MLRIVTSRRLDELKQKEHQLFRMQQKCKEAHRWLAEFPRVCSTIHWIDAVFCVGIDQFRERLRQPLSMEHEVDVH